MTAAVTGELRALDALDHVPAGCRLVLQSDDYHAPHIRPGEFVVIDPNDCGLVLGELFLVQWMGGSQSIMCAKRGRAHSSATEAHTGLPVEESFYYLGPLNRPKFLADGNMDWSQPVHMSDGPYRRCDLQKKLAGRVLGIYRPADETPPARIRP